ncbi:MAG: hypothetical protein IID08_05820 [Candidatus Hydrogenedentes bacterium]|nr:hypothetical protein [Candidatus Hydrogenedentota bacterium]
MKDTILLSAYLTGEEHRSKRDYFNGLEAHLNTAGFELLRVDLVPGKSSKLHTTISLPSFISQAHRIFGDGYINPDSLSIELAQAASLEAEIRHVSVSRAALKLVLYRAFMRNIFKRSKVRLCILWHQFNAFHMALADLCRQEGIPVLYVEYGMLPGTIVFDEEGQMALSWVARNTESYRGLSVLPEHIEQAKRLTTRMREQRRSRKPQDSDMDIASIVQEQRRAGKKILFYAGEHEYHAGILPRSLSYAPVHSPYYSGTLDALNSLAILAESNDWHILFKPHPLHSGQGAPAIPILHDRITAVPGANVFDCIEHSDVVVTLVSQVSYLALIHAKPCVLLGRNPLSGKQCVYEPEDREDLEQALSDALSKGRTTEQIDAWHEHVARICTHYLFASDEDMRKPFGRGHDDAARFIIGHARTSAKSRPGQTTEDAFFGPDRPWIRKPRRLVLAYSILFALEPPMRRLFQLLRIRQPRQDR